MNKLIIMLSLLFIVGCKDPLRNHLRYNDKVVINHDFYGRCTGLVESYAEVSNYKLKLNCDTGYSGTTWVTIYEDGTVEF